MSVTLRVHNTRNAITLLKKTLKNISFVLKLFRFLVSKKKVSKLNVCFLNDLFFQIGSRGYVVLASALELGMDRGTYRGLGTMYEQLCRASDTACSMWSSWRAPDGIVYPLPLLRRGFISSTQGTGRHC